MIKKSIDILGASSKAFSSMVVRPGSLPARSWRAELSCRFIQTLLRQSLTKSHDWLRDCQKLLAMRGPALFKVDSEYIEVKGVKCLQCIPKSERRKSIPTIVYFHGGGYVVGSVDGYHYTLAKLALLCNARVIGVDYRLAPEHPFPAPQQDALAVVDAVLNEASPQDHIFLAGDSAGGGMVLNTLRELKEQGRSGAIDGAVLISPWVRPFEPDWLETDVAEHDILSEPLLERWSGCFGDNHTESVRVSDFSETSFIGFPPIYVQVAGSEMFKPQVDDLVKRLRADRVNTAYDVFPDMFHVFQTFSPLVPEADRALTLIAKKMERFS
jgi:acetyl esterase/lipase